MPFQELRNARALVEALHVAAVEEEYDIIARDVPGRGKPPVAVAVRKGRHGQSQIAEGAHWLSRHFYKHKRESLDHILVSEEFHDHSRKRRWSFREMEILNDHLNREEFEELVASDHGLVRACFDWNPMLKEVGAA